MASELPQLWVSFIWKSLKYLPTWPVALVYPDHPSGRWGLRTGSSGADWALAFSSAFSEACLLRKAQMKRPLTPLHEGINTQLFVWPHATLWGQRHGLSPMLTAWSSAARGACLRHSLCGSHSLYGFAIVFNYWIMVCCWTGILLSVSRALWSLRMD